MSDSNVPPVEHVETLSPEDVGHEAPMLAESPLLPEEPEEPGFSADDPIEIVLPEGGKHELFQIPVRFRRAGHLQSSILDADPK